MNHVVEGGVDLWHVSAGCFNRRLDRSPDVWVCHREAGDCGCVFEFWWFRMIFPVLLSQGLLGVIPSVESFGHRVGVGNFVSYPSDSFFIDRVLWQVPEGLLEPFGPTYET